MPREADPRSRPGHGRCRPGTTGRRPHRVGGPPPHGLSLRAGRDPRRHRDHPRRRPRCLAVEQPPRPWRRPPTPARRSRSPARAWSPSRSPHVGTPDFQARTGCRCAHGPRPRPVSTRGPPPATAANLPSLPHSSTPDGTPGVRHEDWSLRRQSARTSAAGHTFPFSDLFGVGLHGFRRGLGNSPTQCREPGLPLRAASPRCP